METSHNSFVSDAFSGFSSRQRKIPKGSGFSAESRLRFDPFRRQLESRHSVFSTVRQSRIIMELNRLTCAHTEQTRLSEVFCGKQYSSDCTEPRECSPVGNRLPLALEPSKSQDDVSETPRRPPYRYRHKAGCNGKVSRLSPQSPHPLPQSRGRAVALRESSGRQKQ